MQITVLEQLKSSSSSPVARHTFIAGTWDLGLISLKTLTCSDSRTATPFIWTQPTATRSTPFLLRCGNLSKTLSLLGADASSRKPWNLAFALQLLGCCSSHAFYTLFCNYHKITFVYLQEEAVEYIASTIHKLQNKGDGKRRLFLIQTYVIGKEHILIEVIGIQLGQSPSDSDNFLDLADEPWWIFRVYVCKLSDICKEFVRLAHGQFECNDITLQQDTEKRTYVAIALMQVFKRCKKRIFLSEKKMGFMECLDMPGEGILLSTQILTFSWEHLVRT